MKINFNDVNLDYYDLKANSEFVDDIIKVIKEMKHNYKRNKYVLPMVVVTNSLILELNCLMDKYKDNICMNIQQNDEIYGNIYFSYNGEWENRLYHITVCTDVIKQDPKMKFKKRLKGKYYVTLWED